jgi:intraflagellar transport protein 172
LAVADTDGWVHLFDENGDRRDKFPTKSASGKRGGKTYIITGIAFSPDDSRIAIAQSDNIVFVYKLGTEWGDKKIICNKYEQKVSVTCICWPFERNQEFVFGTADGKVKVGNMKNKAQSLFSADSSVVSLAPSPDGHGFVSGHLDGSIYMFYFENFVDHMGVEVNDIPIGHQKITQHSCTPYSLSWGAAIVAAGQDKQVVFYSTKADREGVPMLQKFDYSNVKNEKEFTAIVASPSGQSVVVGSYNRFRLFNFNLRRGIWEEGEVLEVPNLYTITAAAWKPDGSRLVLGNLCGGVDMFDACIKRYRYKGEFEFTYVSPSQVIVKRLSSGTRIVLKSLFEEEILKVNVARDQFLVGHTPRTLLLGDLESCKLSEIPWNASPESEKFFFDNPRVCMVYNAGEISLIEYGINDIIGSFRTEHVSTHLISARISDVSAFIQKEMQKDPNAQVVAHDKKVAFLIDSHTINILDLMSSFTIAKISHDAKIDWLELNVRATKLLFRDKQRHLHLFDIKTQTRTTLLTYCSYVQWVPDSDVVVAQNRGDLCVWYSIDAPDRVTIVPIKGDVEDIVRSQNCTTVIVDEGPGTVNYDLDEGLIEFGSAMEDKDYERAADILEQLSLTPETEAMWKNLSELVLKDSKFYIAERCFAALGDISKANYLHKLAKGVKEVEANEEEAGLVDPLDHWKIRTKLAILNKDFKTAEQVYLEQGKVQEAMSMYKEMHKFDESIAIAFAKNVPNAQTMKDNYLEWLISSRQEDKAARIYENQAQYQKAIQLYLNGGFPASAANVVIRKGSAALTGVQEKTLDQISQGLFANGLYEKAGEFFQKRNMNEKAIEAYRKGHSYRYAVELARNIFPNLVVKLEEEWGDYLMSQKQVDSAVHHYIEANDYVKAIEAALQARQWTKAVQILEGLEPSAAKNYYVRIARHYEEVQNYAQAKKFFIKAEEHNEAMEMYERVGQWDQVQEIAELFMNKEQIKALYATQATTLEGKQKFKEAEKLYLKAEEHDLAINMYRKNHMFDDMIRLVSAHRTVHLKDAHIQIGKQLEQEGLLKQAEYHYIQGDSWKSAVDMYRNGDKWNDAIRVAQSHGGPGPYKKLAWEWAQTVGGEAGAKLLYKLGFIEEAIEYCIQRELWEKAFEMARSSMKTKILDIHLRYANSLEDENRFKEAEEEYINGQSPKEAIEMYVHQSDWSNALRVAETYDSALINYVLDLQADYMFKMGDYEASERIYIQAKKPEKIIQKYAEQHMFKDAKRVADTYSMVDMQRKLNTDWARYIDDESSEDPAAPGRMFVQSGEFSKAIDTYLNFDWKSGLQSGSLSADYCEEAWLEAVKIALNHLQARLGEVVKKVTARLLELKRPAKTAEVFVIAGLYKDAVETLMQESMWGEAIQVAKQSGKQDLVTLAQQGHKKYLNSSQNPEELVQGGNVVAAIDNLAQRGDWEQCLELAKKNGREDQVSKYNAMYVTQLVKGQRHLQALQVLETYGLPIELPMVNIYKDIVRQIVWTHPTSKDVQRCREMLGQLLEGFRTQNLNDPSLNVLRKFHQITHLITMKTEVENVPEMHEIYAKICVSLLRYCDNIPPDAAFYEAGMACRKEKWDSMAFVFLNRYLDIVEAIDEIEVKEGDTQSMVKGIAELENADFQGTDIPYKVPVPTEQFLDAHKRDEVTSVVLEQSVDSSLQGAVDKHPCDNCSAKIYVASLVCPKKCGAQYQPCIITGYPVMKGEMVECTRCKGQANRNDWNDYISKFKNCPKCGDRQLTAL